MRRSAVIDTETTWRDAVMFIRLVIADAQTFALTDAIDELHIMRLPGHRPERYKEAVIR